MKVVFVLAVVASFFADNHALPVGKERQREDVVTKCLVEVLSKALTKPDSQPLEQECKDILKAGSKHTPLEKKSDEEVLTHEEEVKGHEEVPETKRADVEALLQSVAEKRENPEDERSQESWGLDDEKDKRSVWRATHLRPALHRVHSKHRKRDEEEGSQEEPDEERSQESWGLDDEKDKRSVWRATHLRPALHRVHSKHRKRDEEGLEEARDEDEERSQESWGLDDEKDKRSVWRATHLRPALHRVHSKHRKREEEEGSQEEPDEERSQESWGLDDEKEKRHDEEEEGEEEDGEKEKRSVWRATHLRPALHRVHSKHRKRDEEPSEEARDEDEERSQESWGLDKRSEEESDGRDKRYWKPTHRYHHKKIHHKRDGGSSSEEVEERRSDSGEYEEKRHGDAEEEEEREREEALRYLAEKRSEMERHLLGEGEVYDKRSPWIYRGHYHPAWWKRSPEGHTVPSHKLEDLAKLLSRVRNEVVRHSEEEKRSLHQRPLTTEEDKELENLAAMDMELQQIAEKMHDNRSE